MKINNRYPCVIGTAGHIDHGKTSLVAALTGVDTDKLPEEKRRGISIDLGFAGINLGEDGSPVFAGLVDVPGHERFIKNMLAGSSGIDVALICVAADDGIMPQTREHFEIIRLLGVSEAVFAITKSDCVKPERLNEAAQAVAGLIRPTAFADSPIIAVSSKTGTGMGGLKALLRQAALRAIRPDALSDAMFRLPIDRCFHVKGFGTVVTGTVASGSIKKGAELLCYPSGAVVKVRGIESLHESVDEIRAGQRAAINITVASGTDTGRGVMLISPELSPFIDTAAKPPVFADCSFEFIKDIDLKKGRKVFKAHHLTAESAVTIRLSNEDASSGRLVMARALLALRGDRIILRDTGRNETIGVAVVNALWLDKKTMPKRPLPSFLAASPLVGKPAPSPLVGEGRGEGEEANQLLLFRTPGPIGADEGEFELLRNTLETCKAVKLTEAALIFNIHKEALSEAIAKAPDFTIIGGYIMTAKTAHEAEKRLLDAVAQYHILKPTEPGMSEDAALKALRLKDSDIAKTLLEGLIVANRLIKKDALIAAIGFHPTSNSADAKIEASVKSFFSTGFSQRGMDELEKLPYKKTDVNKVFAWLVRNGAIIKICEGSYLSSEAVNEARRQLTAHLKTNQSIKAAEFRDMLGCGRKLAIEILEYFDKERVTLRQGDIRTLR